MDISIWELRQACVKWLTRIKGQVTRLAVPLKEYLPALCEAMVQEDVAEWLRCRRAAGAARFDVTTTSSARGNATASGNLQAIIETFRHADWLRFQGIGYSIPFGLWMRWRTRNGSVVLGCRSLRWLRVETAKEEPLADAAVHELLEIERRKHGLWRLTYWHHDSFHVTCYGRKLEITQSDRLRAAARH